MHFLQKQSHYFSNDPGTRNPEILLTNYYLVYTLILYCTSTSMYYVRVYGDFGQMYFRYSHSIRYRLLFLPF